MPGIGMEGQKDQRGPYDVRRVSGGNRVSTVDVPMVNKIKTPSDGIIKLYPYTKTFTNTTSPFEALEIVGLSDYGSMKVASGVPGKFASVRLDAEFAIGPYTTVPVVIPEIHFGILTTEYNATITSNIESTDMLGAIFGMTNQDLSRYEELGVLKSKNFYFMKSDLTATGVIQAGHIEIDLTSIIQKVQQEYFKAEITGETGELPKRLLVACIESDIDSIGKAIKVVIRTILHATKVPNFSKVT